MALTDMNNDRPIIITGKHGTGKSTKARAMLSDPIIVYGNSIDLKDIRSIPKDRGILIEDIHHKPKKDAILDVLRNYRGKIVMTSLNEKSVPAEIKNMCKFKRAGSVQHCLETIKELAPRSEEPFSMDRSTFDLVMDYLKMPDRDNVVKLFKHNKPADTQILSWLVENIHPNRLIFIDAVAKRRWSLDYFYELLAYSHAGKHYSRPSFPKRGSYSKMPNLCRRIGLKGGDGRLLRMLCEDETFVDFAKKKFNNAECRLLGIGEKKKRKPKPKPVKNTKLSDYYAMDGEISP